MQFKYDSVEELLSAPEVSAVIEAQVSEEVHNEREDFERSMDDSEEALKAAEETKEALEAELKEAKETLEKAEQLIAEMEKDKRVSDAILDLQSAGFKFDSEEEIKAFADKISDMSEESSNYVIDLMKKTIVAEAEEPEAEEPEEGASEEVEGEEAEENQDEESNEVVEASQKASGSESADEDGKIASIRNSWKERVALLKGEN